MKKVMYLLIPIILLVGIFLFVENVKATNVVPLHYSQQPDIFFTRRGGGYDYVSMAFPYYEINGDVVYCIETGVQVTDWDYMLIEDGYTDENGFNLPYDKDIMSKIQLIGHYGYTYPGHEHYNYRIATQSLIWEIQGNTIVELWTERYGYGGLLNVDKEKAEIMALVNSHYDKPSFNGSSKTAYLNQEIVLEDTSGVLNRFEVYDDGGNEVKIVDNKLYITPKTTGETTISLIKSNYDNLTTIVYGGVDGVSQKMARLRAADPVVSSINLDTSGAKITIKKVDSETKTTTPQGEASLKGAKYNVINSNNEVVETLTIGDDFTATSDYLPLGTYTVKEVSPSTGYKLDQTTYTITINSSDNAYLEVKEEIIKGKIKVVKNDSETNSCNPSGTATLNGAKYEIRDSKNNLVDTITIGNDCTAISKDLPYGKYTIKESVAPTGYNLDSNNYSVDIKNSDTIEITSKDEVIKGRIKINKIDNETNSCTSTGQATLKGAKFKITNHNNEVVDTITIKEDCTAVSKDLPYGKYKIQEIESPAGYNLNSEVFEQTITEKKDYSITVKNEVIKNYISILKQYDYVDGNTTFLNAEANITFEIYYEDGTKYGEITTDKNGYATIELPYGNWRFHQVNSSDGFEKIYDFIIKIDENSELEQYYNILNNKIASYLQIVKKDSETGKTIALPNVKFKIFNVDTNQYVSQYVGGKVYDNFITDENGIATTYLKLEAGNYKLKEIESPKGYLLSKDELEFSIGENSEYYSTTYGSFVVVEFENNPIKGRLEINKLGERFILKDSSIYNNLFLKNSSFTNNNVFLKNSSFINNKPLLEDYNFIYDKLLLKGVKFNLYADEDIKTADGNYLYYSKDELIETLITNEDGYAISSKLPLGKYYVVEVETNDNYVLNTEEYHFELVEIDNTTAIVYNTYKAFNYLKKGTLEFTKLDLSTSEPLPNTLIEIYTENNELVFTGITNEEGKITIKDLVIGKYYILEKEAPEGYILNEDKMYFEIKENGEVVKSTMTNEKMKGTLQFTKLDLSTSEPLPNTLIEIYTENDELVFTDKTNENGNIIIEELEYGKYYILEKEAPIGYVLNEEKMYFEIKEDGEVVKSIMTNEKIKGTLEFTKTDFSTSEPLPNTLIEIYKENDKLIFTGRTNEEGKIIIEELEYGKYYILEKEAPESYVLNEDKMYFEIKEDGEVVKSTMTNEKIKGTLEFTKTDFSTSEPLPNTLIEIYKENDELIFTGRTNEEGKIIIEELEYGKYYILEKEAPEGYVLREDKMYFEIKEDGEVVKSTMTNDLIVIAPNTLMNDTKIVAIIGITLIIIGGGLIIYDKTKKRK